MPDSWALLPSPDHILLQSCKNRSHLLVKGLTSGLGPYRICAGDSGVWGNATEIQEQKKHWGATIDHTYEGVLHPLVYVQSNDTTYGLNDNKMCATYLSVNLNFLSLDSNYLTCLEEKS
jgi:hypothetical protein